MTDAWEMHQAETGLNPGPVWRDRGTIIAQLTARNQALEERVAELELAALNLRDETQGAHEREQALRERLTALAEEIQRDGWCDPDFTAAGVRALAASPAVDATPEPTQADECTCRGMDEKPGCTHGFLTPAAEPQAQGGA